MRRASGRPRAQSPAQRGTRFSAFVSYASLRQKPVFRSCPTSVPSGGAARSARSREVPVRVRLRTHVVESRRQCVPPGADHLPRAHHAGDAACFDDERRRSDVVDRRREREQEPSVPVDDGHASGGPDRGPGKGAGRLAPASASEARVRAPASSKRTRATSSACARSAFPDRTVSRRRCQISAFPAR